MLQTIKASELFTIQYGQRKLHDKSWLQPGSTPVISAGSSNNGVYCFANIEPKYKEVIACPSTGTVCFATYQPHLCCIDDNCLVLHPKFELTKKLGDFYVYCIRQLQPFYFYGRQVTPSRLGNTQIPNLLEAEKFMSNIDIDSINRDMDKKLQPPLI
jgi:hypothetical protein